MQHRPGWPPAPPNDDDAHTIGALMARSRIIEDGTPFLEIDCLDGTRVWVTPGMGTSYPDASKSDEEIRLSKRIRDLTAEIGEVEQELAAYRDAEAETPDFSKFRFGRTNRV